MAVVQITFLTTHGGTVDFTSLNEDPLMLLGFNITSVTVLLLTIAVCVAGIYAQYMLMKSTDEQILDDRREFGIFIENYVSMREEYLSWLSHYEDLPEPMSVLRTAVNTHVAVLLSIRKGTIVHTIPHAHQYPISEFMKETMRLVKEDETNGNYFRQRLERLTLNDEGKLTWNN